MKVIVLVVPLRLAATALSIYGTLCIGLTTALLTVASGVLYERMGGLAFLVMRHSACWRCQCVSGSVQHRPLRCSASR